MEPWYRCDRCGHYAPRSKTRRYQSKRWGDMIICLSCYENREHWDHYFLQTYLEDHFKEQDQAKQKLRGD